MLGVGGTAKKGCRTRKGTNEGVFSCSAFKLRLSEIRRTRKHTSEGVFSCLAYVVGRRKDADHEMTPTRVSLRAQHL